MSANPQLLLVLYCLAIASVSLLGGLLPQYVHLTHTRTQFIMSLVSGLMLGVAFFHLVPHAVVEIGGGRGVDQAMWWLMVGLITMLMLLRLFHFHQHDFSGQHDHSDDHETGNHGHDHHGHDHGHDHGAAGDAHPLSAVGITLGLGLHTLIDGVALGAVMQGSGVGALGLLGIGVFMAILLHKPLDAMSITTVMQAGGWSAPSRLATNVLFALMCPLGALLFFFGVDFVDGSRHLVVGCALAFSAGTFICIALSDLLPEVHFHSHDRLQLTVLFLVGIGVAWSMGALEPAAAHLMGSISQP